MKTVYWLTFVTFAALPAASSLNAAARSTAFSNQSSDEIYVNQILCDGKRFPMPVGILTPDCSKAGVDMFPKKIPAIFTVEYQKGIELLHQNLDGVQVTKLIKSASRSNDLTLHFVYTNQHEFVIKLEEKQRGLDSGYDAKLWPDDAQPAFQQYKELVRSAYSGDTARLRKALDAGAKYTWPEDPVSLTPLEWTVRWNRGAAFDELMKIIPADYPISRYGNCIKLAAQDGQSVFLEKLLAHPLAKQVKPAQLQEIFYSACYSSKSTACLERLLAFYPVGVDFRVRDYGHTLLWVAVQGGNYEIAQWLVSHGADKNATLRDGSHLINWARDDKMRQLLASP